MLKNIGFIFSTLLVFSCSNQNLSREEFGLSVASFKIFQAGAVTNVLRLTNATQTLTFAVACPTGTNQLMAKAQDTPWVEFHSFSCTSPTSTTLNINFSAAMAALQSAGFAGAITPEVSLEFKLKQNTSESDAISIKILKAEVNPAAVTVSLGAGAAKTNSTLTTLNFDVKFVANSFEFLPTEYYLTDTSGCSSGGTWTSYLSLIPVVLLSDINQVNTKYVKFRDAIGNETSCFQDSIEQDSTAPVLTSVVVNSGALQTNLSLISVAITGVGADISQMAVFNNSSCSGTAIWVPYATSAAFNLTSTGTQFMAVRLRDDAGNNSSCVTDSIVYDIDPPAVPSAIALPAGLQANDNEVSFSLQVSGVIDGDTAKVFSDSSCTTQLGSAVAVGGVGSVQVTLTTDGSYQFYANATDPYSLVSACSSVFVNYTLDRIGPSVVLVTSTTTGDQLTGATVPVAVQFSDPVIVTGTPQLALDLNGNTVLSSYVSGSGSNQLVFQFVVTWDMTEDDLNYTSTTALTLNGGTILDAMGNSATLDLPATNNAMALAQQTNIQVNFTIGVSKTYGPAPGIYGTGDVLDFNVVWSGPVTVSAPTLSLDVGGSTVIATHSAAQSNLTQGRTRFLSPALTTQVDLNGIGINGLSASSIFNIFSSPAVQTISAPNNTATGFKVVGAPVRSHSIGSNLESHILRLSESAGSATVEVLLSAPALEDTVLQYRVIPGSATSGLDFNASSGTVTVLSGQSNVFIPIQILDDVIAEPVETFAINIESSSSSRSSANVSVLSKEIYIVDNDSSTATLLDIGMGATHMCALYNGGAVRCAGGNNEAQLGQGNQNAYDGWVNVNLPGPALQISVGDEQNCARVSVSSETQLYCWGSNDGQALGLGYSGRVLVPTRSTSAGSAVLDVQISKSSSGEFACILVLESGVQKVRCSGSNSQGQLADTSTTSRLTFSNITGISDSVVQFAVAKSSVCAVTATELYCWGENSSGELGLGNMARRTQATLVTASHNITQLIGIYETFCALQASGTVNCWGRGGGNSFGNGVTAIRSSYPGETTSLGISGGQAVSYLTAGYQHFCAVINDQTFRCWGTSVNSGQLLSASPSASQATVNQISGVTLVRATYNSTCFVSGSPSLLSCAGSASSFTGRTFETVNLRTPTVIPQGTSNIRKKLQTSFVSCTLFDSGRLDCVNMSTQAGLGDGSVAVTKNSPVLVAPSNVSDFSLTDYGGCYLKTDSSLWCWGENSEGSVGDGTTTNRGYPVFVIDKISRVISGSRHNCALDTSQALWCWGFNSSGQVGNNSTSRQTAPVKVLTNVTDFSVGNAFSCAIQSNQVLCWGSNSLGQLGDGSGSNNLVPTAAIDVFPGTLVDIESGMSHSCVIHNDGLVKCWGLNSSGQLGRGNTVNSPILWKILDSGVSKASLGLEHTCFLMTDSSTRCFGLSTSYQLGDNQNNVDRTAVNTGSPVIATGVLELNSGRGNATCARTASSYQCWGANYGLYYHRGPLNNWTPKVIMGALYY